MNELLIPTYTYWDLICYSSNVANFYAFSRALDIISILHAYYSMRVNNDLTIAIYFLLH